MVTINYDQCTNACAHPALDALEIAEIEKEKYSRGQRESTKN